MMSFMTETKDDMKGVWKRIHEKETDREQIREKIEKHNKSVLRLFVPKQTKSSDCPDKKKE